MNNVSDISLTLSSFWETFSLFWWIILPIVLFYIFEIIWIDFTLVYSDNSWRSKQQWTVLEIVPPREIERGPKVMESIMTGLAGVITTYHTFDRYLKGAWENDRFSFELVGEEGKIHFLVHTQKKHQPMLEAQFYAQYPGVEIFEVPDYTKNFPKVVPNRDWDLWGTDFEFISPDPIPIKTYDRFEESITGEMIDPMAAITETLGLLGPGQHIWLQFAMRPLHEGTKKNYDSVIKKLKGEKVIEPLGIIGDIVDIFSNIFKGMSEVVKFGPEEKKEMQPLEFRLSPGEKDLLKATEENIGKNLYKTKMRYIYIARKENWNGSFKGAVVGAIKQFNDMNYNQVRPEDVSKTYSKIFFTKSRGEFRRRKIYDRYRNRNMDGCTIVFSSKEMATLFHLPDMGVKSPAIRRVESKLGSAPANLPVE